MIREGDERGRHSRSRQALHAINMGTKRFLTVDSMQGYAPLLKNSEFKWGCQQNAELNLNVRKQI